MRNLLRRYRKKRPPIGLINTHFRIKRDHRILPAINSIYFIDSWSDIRASSQTGFYRVRGTEGFIFHVQGETESKS